MAMPSPFDAARLACSLDQPSPQPRKAALNAGVDQFVADLDRQPTDEPLIC
jgi:hypothetical protein